MNAFEPTTKISDMKFKNDNSMPDIAPWIERFTASPIAGDPGASVTLDWATGLADSVIISPGVGLVEPNGNAVVTPAVTTTYTITAANANGQSQKDVVVNISDVPRGTATALALRQVTAISADFDAVEAGLQEMERNYAGKVYAVATAQGMADARRARDEIRDIRYRVQNAVTNAKRPLNALKSAIEGRGEQIIERIFPVEDPIHEQIKAEEKRKAIEKAERDRIVTEKAKAVTLAIEAILESLTTCANQPVEVIDLHIALIEALDISLEQFGDRAGEAEQIKTRTLRALVDMRVERTAFETMRAEIERREQEQRRRQQEEDERRAEARRAEEARIEQQRKDNAAEAQKLADERYAFQVQQEAARAAQRKREDAERAERQRKEDAMRSETSRFIDAQREELRRADETYQAERRAELPAETERLAQVAEAKKKLHDAAAQMLAALDGVQAIAELDSSDVPCREAWPEVFANVDAAIRVATK